MKYDRIIKNKMKNLYDKHLIKILWLCICLFKIYSYTTRTTKLEKSKQKLKESRDLTVGGFYIFVNSDASLYDFSFCFLYKNR